MLPVITAIEQHPTYRESTVSLRERKIQRRITVQLISTPFGTNASPPYSQIYSSRRHLIENVKCYVEA